VSGKKKKSTPFRKLEVEGEERGRWHRRRLEEKGKGEGPSHLARKTERRFSCRPEENRVTRRKGCSSNIRRKKRGEKGGRQGSAFRKIPPTEKGNLGTNPDRYSILRNQRKEGRK